MRSEEKRCVVLTGAAGTIGAAATRQFLVGGFQVVGVDLNAEKLHEMAGTLGPAFQALPADLGTPDGIKQCSAEITKSGMPVYALVNNAGIITSNKFLDTTLEELRHTMSLNFESAFLLSQHLLPAMVAAGQGRIVNVSSFAGRSGGLLAGTAYSLSKAAMLGLTFSLAREFGPHGISTNAVAPAFVESEMMSSSFRKPGDAERLKASIPLRRLCSPDEVASAIVYLASDLAGFINGEVIDINGGIQCD